jgi:hypothetical protein
MVGELRLPLGKPKNRESALYILTLDSTHTTCCLKKGVLAFDVGIDCIARLLVALLGMVCRSLSDRISGGDNTRLPTKFSLLLIVDVS